MNKTKKLNKQNNLLDKQIWEENQEIFTDMICYIRGANISDYDVEVIRHDLTEMVLSAQSRGEDITTLFSDNYKEFCDEVIASIPPKTTKEKFIDALDTTFLGLSILIAINIFISNDFIEIIKALFTKSTVNWNIGLSLGDIIAIMLFMCVGGIIVQTICKKSFDKKKYALWTIVGIIAFIIIFAIISWYGKGIIFNINFFVACAISIVFFIIHKILER